MVIFEIDTHLTQPNIDASFLLQYTQTRSHLYPHLATLSWGRILSMNVSQQMKECLGIAIQIRTKHHQSTTGIFYLILFQIDLH